MRALLLLVALAILATLSFAEPQYKPVHKPHHPPHKSTAKGFQNYNLGLSKGYKHPHHKRAADDEPEEEFGVDADSSEAARAIEDEDDVLAVDGQLDERFRRSADPEPQYKPHKPHKPAPHKSKSTATGFQNNNLGLSKGYGPRHRRAAEPSYGHFGHGGLHHGGFLGHHHGGHYGTARGFQNFNLGLSYGYGHPGLHGFHGHPHF